MKSVFQPAAHTEVLERLGRLTPDHRPRWGRMTARQMVCHLTDQLRVTLGETPVPAPTGLLATRPVRRLVIYGLPWPKGRIQAPQEMLLSRPTEWQADMRNLQALLARVVKQAPDAPWGNHPAFGALSGKEWGVLTYRHFDHHLRQFEV